MSAKFDTLLSSSGELGRWQITLFFVVSINPILVAFHNLGYIFLAATPDHWCDIPEFNNSSWTDEQIKNISIPRQGYNKDGGLQYMQCYYYDLNYTELSKLSFEEALENVNDDQHLQIPCNDKWKYDISIFTVTAATEWNLVCDRRALLATIQASYMSGVLIGSVLFGFLSDKYGRRVIIVICSIISAVSSVAAYFSPNYLVFLIFRFFIAMTLVSNNITGLVLLLESVGPSKRSLMGMLYQVPFGMGFAMLPGLAYYIRDWRTLQLAISAPVVFNLFLLWCLPESPRWLFTKGYLNKTEKILNSMAIANKRPISDTFQMRKLLDTYHKDDTIVCEADSLYQKTNLKGRCCDVLSTWTQFVRTPEMRKRTLCSLYAWFVVGLVYYGLALNAANLPGNLFLVTFVISVTEIPAALLVIPAMNYFGRRIICCATFIIGGTACLFILLVPTDLGWLAVSLAMAGKFSISATFCLLFLYVAELFPTVLRNLSVGSTNVSCRIGSLIAPYIIEQMVVYHHNIPVTMFGVCGVSAGIVCLLLPETSKMRMPDTVQDVENSKRCNGVLPIEMNEY